jgi:tRNA modification GTPase
MDVSQAEAVIDLISAETPWAAGNAAGQLSGTLKRRVEAIYNSLLDVAAHFQAVMDYTDDDIEAFDLESARSVLEKARLDTAELAGAMAGEEF